MRRDRLPEPARLLDVGCGVGALQRATRAELRWPVSLHRLRLRRADDRRRPRTLAGAHLRGRRSVRRIARSLGVRRRCSRAHSSTSATTTTARSTCCSAPTRATCSCTGSEVTSGPSRAEVVPGYEGQTTYARISIARISTGLPNGTEGGSRRSSRSTTTSDASSSNERARDRARAGGPLPRQAGADHRAAWASSARTSRASSSSSRRRGRARRLARPGVRRQPRQRRRHRRLGAREHLGRPRRAQPARSSSGTRTSSSTSPARRATSTRWPTRTRISRSTAAASSRSSRRAAQHNPDAKIVFASTRQIYGRPRYLPVDEEHPLDPVGRQRDQQDWQASGTTSSTADVYGLRVCCAPADEHVRAADARPGRSPDVPRVLVPALSSAGQPLDDLRRRRATAGLQLRRRRRARVPARRGARRGAWPGVYNLGDREVVCLRELAEAARRGDGRGLVRAGPVPARPQDDRHRRLLRRLRQHPSRALGWDAAGRVSTKGSRGRSTSTASTARTSGSGVNRSRSSTCGVRRRRCAPNSTRRSSAVLDEAWFVLGPAVEGFEQAFAGYCGAGHAVGVASGTDAIDDRAAGLRHRPGDEVITAANTCVPTVAGIEAAGASPCSRMSTRRRITLDPTSVEQALTSGRVPIVPVHLYGQCADMAGPARARARTRAEGHRGRGPGARRRVGRAVGPARSATRRVQLLPDEEPRGAR